MNRLGTIFGYLLTCLLAGLIVRCGETAKADAEKTLEVTHEKSTSIDHESSQLFTFVDSIRVLAEVDPRIFPFSGHFFLSLSWNDKLGCNVLILSEDGEYEEGTGQRELFAYHYIRRGGFYDVLWQMHDSVVGLGCDLNIQLIDFFPLISDVDSNGVAEAAIFYSLDNRCDAVAFPATLIVHEGTGEIAISGMRNQCMGPPENLLNEYRAEDGLPPLKYKNLETGTQSLDSSIINFYSQQWDEFISLENALNGSLPDSLIRVIN